MSESLGIEKALVCAVIGKGKHVASDQVDSAFFKVDVADKAPIAPRSSRRADEDTLAFGIKSSSRTRSPALRLSLLSITVQD